MNLNPLGIALAATIGLAQSQTIVQESRPEFEVASVKPSGNSGLGMGIAFQPGGRVSAQNVPLHFLIQFAYSARIFQVIGGPTSVNSDRWDVAAKADANTSRDQIREMVQMLLTDRFRLKVHREIREASVYNLVIAKGGMKLRESTPDGCIAQGPETPRPPLGGPIPNFCGTMRMRPNGDGFEAWKVGPKQLVMFLSDLTGRMVVDKTGLTGPFDIHLQYARDEGPAGGALSSPPSDTNAPSIFTAMQEQLGLRLESSKAPTEFLVVNHAEKPDSN